MHTAILDLHIVSGTLGMLSGFVAVFLGKGSPRHGIAGNVFVITMMSLSLTGVYLALMKLSAPGQPPNVIGGTLTFYLVTTAWLTARRPAGTPGIVDWGALVVVLSVAAVEVTWGVDAAMSPTRLKYAYPPGPYFFMGSLAGLAATGDVRMIVRRGIAGTGRMARHLWRMCFALFIASVSIFSARQRLFPVFMRKTGMLMLLSFLPLLLMIYWLIRVRVARARRKNAWTAAGSQPSLWHVQSDKSRNAAESPPQRITRTKEQGTRNKEQRSAAQTRVQRAGPNVT